MTSQCSTRIPSSIRRMSAAIQLGRQPEAREPSVDDDEVSLRYDYSRLIPEGGRDALDQVEETVTAWLNVRTVLNVVGRPEALRCRIISLIKQGLEGFQHNRLIVLCF